MVEKYYLADIWILVVLFQLCHTESLEWKNGYTTSQNKTCSLIKLFSRNYYFLGFLLSEFEKRNLTDVEFKTAGKKLV